VSIATVQLAGSVEQEGDAGGFSDVTYKVDGSGVLNQIVHSGISDDRSRHLSVKVSGGADVKQTDSVSEFRQVSVDGQSGSRDVHVRRVHNESVTER